MKGCLGYATMFAVTDVPSNFHKLHLGSCFGSFYQGSILNDRPGTGQLPAECYLGSTGRREYKTAEQVWAMKMERPDVRDKYRMEGEFILYLRLGTAITTHQADLFLDEFALPNIPDRLKDSFTIHTLTNREYEQVWATMLEDIRVKWCKDTGKPDNTPYPPASIETMENQKGVAWKKVVFDLSKIGPSDLFAVCTLLRYPQEFSVAVVEMQRLQRMLPNMDTGIAFLNSHMAMAPIIDANYATRNEINYQSAHGLLDYTVFSMICRGQVFKDDVYSLVKLWPEKWKDEESVATGNRNKANIQTYFSSHLKTMDPYLERKAA